MNRSRSWSSILPFVVCLLLVPARVGSALPLKLTITESSSTVLQWPAAANVTPEQAATLPTLPYDLVEAASDLQAYSFPSNQDFWSAVLPQSFPQAPANNAYEPADAGGPKRFYRIRRYWSLGGASLAGVNLAGANLAGLDLTDADLTGANLRGANLQGTDLRGVRLEGADLTDARLDGALLPGDEEEVEDPETDKVVLDHSGLLISAGELRAQVNRDLVAIRQAFPVVATVRHVPRWQPGVLLVPGTRESALAWLQINKPPVLIWDDGSLFSLRISTRINPETLVGLLRMRPGGEVFSVSRLASDASDVIRIDDSGSIYTFRAGWGDCMSGCGLAHYWVFGVTNGVVSLIGEHGSPLPPGWPVRPF